MKERPRIVASSTAEMSTYVPLVAAWVEDQLIVTRVRINDGSVHPGDRILSLEGRPSGELLEEMEAIEPAATPQWKRLRALQDLARCKPNGIMVMTVEPYAAPGTTVNLHFSCRAADSDRAPSGHYCRGRAQNLYVDIGRLTAETFDAAIPRLEAASGIVWDFRGYPQIWPPAFLQHILTEDLKSEQFYIPTPALPDQKDMTYEYAEWTLPAVEPRFAGKSVFLTDASAISQAETDLDFVEHYKLGEMISEAHHQHYRRRQSIHVTRWFRDLLDRSARHETWRRAGSRASAYGRRFLSAGHVPV